MRNTRVLDFAYFWFVAVVFPVSVWMCMKDVHEHRAVPTMVVVTQRSQSEEWNSRKNGVQTTYWIHWNDRRLSPQQMRVGEEEWQATKVGDICPIVVRSNGDLGMKQIGSGWLIWSVVVGAESIILIFWTGLLIRRWKHRSERWYTAGSAMFGDKRSLRRFARIADAFRISGNQWYGPVVAAADAIYFCKVSRSKSTGDGDFVGALVARVVKALVPMEDGVTACHYKELPEAIRKHSDWPIPDELDCPVIVMGRDNVGPLHHPRFTNLIKFNHEDQHGQIEYDIMTGGGTRDYLAGHGWPIRWGEAVYNLDSKQPKAKGRTPMSASARWAYNLIAIGATFLLLLALISNDVLPGRESDAVMMVVLCAAGIGFIMAVVGILLARRAK